MNRAALLLCALFLCTVSAAAQQPAPLIHDDLSGTIEGQFVMKARSQYDNAGAFLTFDIDYQYKASLLMGEPMVVCSTHIRNPRGHVRFEHHGELHTVEINEENAGLLTPYNVDYAIAYREQQSIGTFYIARCNTGIPGSWANEALNVPASPNWNDFLCWTGGSRPGRPDPMPDSLGADWCKTIGSPESKTVDEAKTKNHFTAGGMHAFSVHVASFAVNYADVILAETKKLSAHRIAQRKFDQVAQIRDSLSSPPRGAQAQAAQQLDSAVAEAKAVSNPREQARLLQDAIRDVLSIPPTEEGAPEFAELRALILKLFSGEERTFIESVKQTLADMQALSEQSGDVAAASLDAHRAAAASAPKFAFASGATGPEATKREIQKIEGHDGKAAYRVLFHPDGKRLLSKGGDATLRLWDIASGTEIWRKDHYSSDEFEFSADGRHVFASGYGSVERLHTESGSEDKTVAVTDGYLKKLIVSPNGRYLFCNMSAKTAVWDIQNGQTLNTFSTRGLWLRSVSEDGSRLMFLDVKDNLVLKNINGDTLLKRPFGDARPIFLDRFDNQYSADTHNIIVRMNDEIHFTSYDQPITSPRRQPIVDGKISDFAASEDGRFILYGKRDGEVRLVDRSVDGTARLIGRHDRVNVTSSESEEQEPEERGDVYGVTFSPDGKLAASAGVDGTIRIWEL